MQQVRGTGHEIVAAQTAVGARAPASTAGLPTFDTAERFVKLTIPARVEPVAAAETEEASHAVQISKHAVFKELDDLGRMREILSGLPLDTEFARHFNGYSGLMTTPAAAPKADITEAAVTASQSFGVLSL